MKGRIGIVLVVLAVAAAVASALYYLKVQEVVERTTKVVEVAAPDLYPADTLLFAAAHRMDESWNTLESWWKRFERTAAYHAGKREADRARAEKRLPPQAVEAEEKSEKFLAEVEKRLGCRPDSKAFFETYGKYTAFGLLPAKDAGRPRMLLVVRLPGDAAMATLKEKLGGVTKRHEPPDLHGYPAWEEESEALGKVFYGVGGGHLFVADDPAVLGDSLGRLAALVGTEKPPEGAAPAAALSGDAVFRRGVPGAWTDVGLAVFARKEQQFERWNANLKLVDEFVRHAFVLAPQDPAVALAAIRAGGQGEYAVRASFCGQASRKPWPELLPSGASMAWMTAPPKGTLPRETLLAGVETFRRKEIWKEADALLRDTPRLKRILAEALGPEGVPDDEILRRLPEDGAFVADAFRALAERSALSPSASFAFAQAVVEGDPVHAEAVLAARFDPLESLLVAAALDLATEHGGEIAPSARNPLERNLEGGVRSWRFHLVRFLEDMAGDGMESRREPMFAGLSGVEPAVVLHDGTFWLTFGEEMHRRIRALAAGTGKTLAGDEIFREAAAAVPADPRSLYFERPAESWRGVVGGVRGMLNTAFPMDEEAPHEGRQVAEAALAALEEIALWQKGVRAAIAADYADPARPDEAAVLLDVVEEAKHPRLRLPPAALAAPDLLPAGTFLLGEGRVDLRPGTEAVVAAFLRGLPGGRARWDELRAELEVPREEIEGRLEALLVDMKGEAGAALAVPAADGPGRIRGTQDLIDRAPALVLFAAYADPDRAFATAKDLLRMLAEATSEPGAYEERKAAFFRREGPPPVGTEYSEEAGANPSATIRVVWPERPRAPDTCAGLSVVRRGNLIFLTTSIPVGRFLATAEPGAPGTLGARMRSGLPAGTVPAEVAGLAVFREDGFADCFALYARPLAPELAAFTVRGDENGPPPEDRVLAHREGWTRVAELLEDLCRTGKWQVGATVREKDRWRSTGRRVPGK